MSLVNGLRPYVHSNYVNFRRRDNLFLAKKNSALIDSKANQLIEIAEQLYQAANTFFGGQINVKDKSSMMRMSRIILGLDNPYYQAAVQTINDKDFLNLLVKQDTIYNLRDLKSILKKETINYLMKQHPNEIIDSFCEKEILVAIANTLPKNAIEIRENGAQKVNINNLNRGFFKGFENQIVNNTKKVLQKNGKTFEELLRKQLQKTNTGHSKGAKSGEAQAKFKEKYYSNLEQITNSLYDPEIAKRSLDQILQLLPKNFFNKVRSTIGEARGDAGEQGISAIINVVSNNNETKIIASVIGDKKEKDVMLQEYKTQLTNESRRITHDISRQSYSDIILTNAKTNERARVQSKNYLASVYKWLNMENTQGILTSITTDSSTKNLFDFLQEAENHNSLSSYDEGAVAYTLANEMWFKNHTNYGSDKNLGKKSGFDFNYINRALSDVLINFIGVVVDEGVSANNIIINQSNLFFLFDNSVILPTGLIVESIANNLKKQSAELINLNVRLVMNGSPVWARADGFYNAKMSALSSSESKLTKGVEKYSNTDLLDVGYTQGESIIKGLRLNEAKLRFNLKDVLDKSAYNM